MLVHLLFPSLFLLGITGTDKRVKSLKNSSYYIFFPREPKLRIMLQTSKIYKYYSDIHYLMYRVKCMCGGRVAGL